MKGKYCVAYSTTTHYETEWFTAESKKDAIQKTKDIIGFCKVERIICKPEEKSNGKISRRKRKSNRG